jgi:UDP-glucose 4-epimerase
MILKALRNEAIDFNSGKNSRDYVFVSDIVDAIIKASLIKGNFYGEIFNIGTSEAISGRRLAEKVLQLSDSSSKINFGAFPDREGEAPEWRVDSSKAKMILNWRAKTSFEKGLINTIDYYRKGVLNESK